MHYMWIVCILIQLIPTLFMLEQTKVSRSIDGGSTFNPDANSNLNGRTVNGMAW